jgi:hypothetical protein
MRERGRSGKLASSVDLADARLIQRTAVFSHSGRLNPLIKQTQASSGDRHVQHPRIADSHRQFR